MNENLQKLEVKIENQGTTPQGKVSAAEWNILVSAVKALDAAGIDTETLAKYLKQYQYITTPELEELLKDVTENLDGVVDLKSAQTIEGLKDFINGFKIGGALVKYDTAKKCFIFTENVLFEKGMAWNSRLENFTDEEIFSITKAVDVDWKTIGKNASGQLYVINGGGEGGGGNYDPDFLHNYLTNNKYITESALEPYAKTADVNSLLTDYVDKSSIKKYMGWSQAFHIGQDIDRLNDFGVVSTAGNVNAPSTAAYGIVATFPYRSAYGNSIPDFSAQLYFPNGDEATPHLFWRNSIKNAWKNWRTILDSSNYSDYALPIIGGTVDGNITATKFIGALAGNADSATKLATPRTLWGQEFSGTSDVSGSIMGVNILRYINGGSGIFLRGSLYSSQLSNSDIGFEAETAAFSGKVAIGGSVANEALHVHGNVKVEGSIATNRIVGDVKLTSLAINDNADSGRLIFAGSNYEYEDNESYRMGPYIQGINVGAWGKKRIGIFQRDYSVEGYNADPVEVFSIMPNGDVDIKGSILATGNVSAQSVIINGKSISYNADKNAFVLRANLLVEGGFAWNSKIDGFDVPTITDAVSIDGTSIIRDGGVLRVNPDYVQSVGGLDESELASYLTTNKYITDSALQPYAKTADVNSWLTDYVDKTSIKKYMGWSQAHHIGQDIDRLYDFGAVSTAGNVNAPSTAAYGIVATFPYRSAYGNSIPDFSAQLYFPNGNEATPHLFWRNSIKNAWKNWRTILDSSNYSDYALPIIGGTVDGNITATKFIGALEGNADSASKLSTIGLLPESIDRGTIAYSRFDYPENVVGLPIADNANGVLTINTHAGLYHHQLGFSTSGFFYRKVYDRGLNTSGDWKEVAFIDSNVASATKLATSCTIWGQSFDGTSDVSGSIMGVNILRYINGGSGIFLRGSLYSSQLSNSDIGFEAETAAFSGKVAIGGSAANEALHVYGNILATGRIAWNSSRVLKTEIKEHYLSLEKLAQIKPYRYKWEDGRDDLVHVGAIADEVMEIMPETVLTDSLGIHSMDYAQTAFVMAASLTPHVSDHERRIKDMETENEALKQEIEKLKRAA